MMQLQRLALVMETSSIVKMFAPRVSPELRGARVTLELL